METIGKIILVIVGVCVWFDLIKNFRIVYIKQYYKRNKFNTIFVFRRSWFSNDIFYIKAFDEKKNKWFYALTLDTYYQRAKYICGSYYKAEAKTFSIDKVKSIVENYSFDEFYKQFVQSPLNYAKNHNLELKTRDKKENLQFQKDLKDVRKIAN